jgi:hypothetical protein
MGVLALARIRRRLGSALTYRLAIAVHLDGLGPERVGHMFRCVVVIPLGNSETGKGEGRQPHFSLSEFPSGPLPQSGPSTLFIRRSVLQSVRASSCSWRGPSGGPVHTQPTIEPSGSLLLVELKVTSKLKRVARARPSARRLAPRNRQPDR